MKDYKLDFLELESGEKIAFRKAGKGKQSLVLVHGNMSSSVHYQILMEKLEDEFEMYALDLPGFGDSTYNNSCDTLHQMSKYLTEFIIKLDLRDIYLMGWSTGGGISMETAADIPDRVKKLFLLSSVGVQGYPMFRKDSNYQPILTEKIYKRQEIQSDPVQVLPVLNAYSTNNRQFFKTLWQSLIYTKNLPPEDDYEKYIDAILKQRNLVDVDVALANFNITSVFNGVNNGSGRIDNIVCPVEIIHGEDDMVVPKVFAEISANFFGQKSKLNIIKGAGHSILTDKLEELINIIK